MPPAGGATTRAGPPQSVTDAPLDILLVEDDMDVARNVCEYLEGDGHRVEWAPDGVIGLEAATRGPRDAIVLDIALPRLSGLELCRRLRELGFQDVPILMLTARSEVREKVAAFELGADDYLVKPFALEELAGRLRALTRRARRSGGTLLRVADLELDPASQVVRRAGLTLPLTATGRRILETLMRNSHRVLSRAEIEAAVWGDDPPRSNALKIHIHALREHVDRPFAEPLIHTVRGTGYRLCPRDARG
ncbi:MAG: response regulator transcription factor [Gammaproteobacteria bacterium]